MRKIFVFLISFVFLFFVSPIRVRAENYRWNEWEKDFRVGDVHLQSGGDVDITKDIEGDLMVAGGRVKVSGRVAGDLLIVGGEVEVTGDIDQNLRVVGGRVRVDSHIGRNVTMVGGDITLGGGTLIGGNLVATGGKLDVNEKATVRGKSYITSPPQGKMDFEKKKTKLFGISDTVGTVFTLLSTFVMGALLIFLFPKTVERTLGNTQKKVGAYFLRGIVIAIVLTVVIMTAAFTVIGIPAAFILFFALVVGWYMAGLLARILIGQYLYQLIAKKHRSSKVAKSYYTKILIIGILAFFVLSFVPVIGWGVKVFLTFVALGLLVEQKLHSYRLVEKS